MIAKSDCPHRDGFRPVEDRYQLIVLCQHIGHDAIVTKLFHLSHFYGFSLPERICGFSDVLCKNGGGRLSDATAACAGQPFASPHESAAACRSCSSERCKIRKWVFVHQRGNARAVVPRIGTTSHIPRITDRRSHAYSGSRWRSSSQQLSFQLRS